MLLGKRVLGEALAAAEAAANQGGAVVAVRLGPRVLGVQAAPVTEPVKAARAARPRTVRTSGNRVVAAVPVNPAPGIEPPAAPKPKAGRKARPEELGFSEEKVEAMLAEDANVWDVVLDAESKRPEGQRAAVAAMLLAAADRADVKPMPDAIAMVLERLASPAPVALVAPVTEKE